MTYRRGQHGSIKCKQCGRRVAIDDPYYGNTINNEWGMKGFCSQKCMDLSELES